MNLSFRLKALALWLAAAFGGLLLYAVHLTMYTAGIVEGKQHPILPELFWYFAVIFALPVQTITLLVFAKNRIAIIITNIIGIIYLLFGLMFGYQYGIVMGKTYLAYIAALGILLPGIPAAWFTKKV
ncbi:hypothetical protein [Chryseobacterium shandongense]|uniref:hypothetical protein n=1 Tax=Chryseobacterium shandongense TaxID=1493872 RepID=UPI0013DE1D83|nr:hypothetical protein [Chryseobacterium shandongense]